MNSGQACVAQTRVLVPAARQDEFVDAMAAMVEALVVGDPEDRATEIGPLVSQRQQERVRGYIEQGIADGARLVAGGADQPEGLDRGWYVRPTLFADVDNATTIAREEIFGPVLSVIPYADTDDAVRLANDSDYGLSGSVWTADAGRGLDVARRIRTGSFGINEPYSMDPAAPFGGMKAQRHRTRARQRGPRRLPRGQGHLRRTLRLNPPPPITTPITSTKEPDPMSSPETPAPRHGSSSSARRAASAVASPPPSASGATRSPSSPAARTGSTPPPRRPGPTPSP